MAVKNDTLSNKDKKSLYQLTFQIHMCEKLLVVLQVYLIYSIITFKEWAFFY